MSHPHNKPTITTDHPATDKKNRGIFKKAVMAIVLVFILSWGGWAWYQVSGVMQREGEAMKGIITKKGTPLEEVAPQNAEFALRQVIKMGEILVWQGKYQKAEHLFQTAIRQVGPPDNARLYVYLAAVQARQGKKEEAAGSLDKAFEIKPSLQHETPPDTALSPLWN